jgi:HlyD family secretion protein
MPDNKELLQQLRLDKSSPPPASGHFGWWLVAGAVIVGAVIWKFMPVWNSAEVPRAEVLNSVSSQPAPATASVAPLTPSAANAPQKILDASGYITARQMATVSAKVMALILSVEVEEGMRVEKGQVLARLDDTQARINLELAKTRVLTQESLVQSLKVDYAEAVRELKRVQNLGSAGNFSSESQLSRAQTLEQKLKANIASAEADLAAARLQVALQQNHLEDHVIRAPFTGVVTTKNAQAGELMSPSSAGGGFTRTGICTIVDMDSLEIQVDVNEAYINRVSEGQKVTAVLDAYPEWKIPASVIAVIPTADRAKATVRVRIRILEKNPKILPDMGVKVSFLAGGTDHE